MIYIIVCLLSIFSGTFEFGVIPNESNKLQTVTLSLEFMQRIAINIKLKQNDNR